MKELSNYITEKLDINKVNIDKHLEFPADSEPSKVFEWLEKYGFEFFFMNDDSIDTQFDNKKILGYTANSSGSSIYFWFADTSKKKISKDNPVFSCKIDGQDNDYYLFWRKKYNHVQKEEFIEKLNKTFNIYG